MGAENVHILKWNQFAPLSEIGICSNCNIYIYRWPLGQSLMGNSGSPTNSTQSPVSANTSHSAFKTVPSSSSSLHSNNNLIGSSCSKEASGLSGHSLPHGNMNLGVTTKSTTTSTSPSIPDGTL